MLHSRPRELHKKDHGKVQRKTPYIKKHTRIIHSCLLLLSPNQSAFRFNLYLVVMNEPLPNVNTRSKQQQQAAAATQLLCA